MSASRRAKIVLSLYNLKFSFFAEIISKGTNLEVISHPKQTVQPQLLSSKANEVRKWFQLTHTAESHN